MWMRTWRVAIISKPKLLSGLDYAVYYEVVIGKIFLVYSLITYKKNLAILIFFSHSSQLRVPTCFRSILHKRFSWNFALSRSQSFVLYSSPACSMVSGDGNFVSSLFSETLVNKHDSQSGVNTRWDVLIVLAIRAQRMHFPIEIHHPAISTPSGLLLSKLWRELWD